MNKSPYEISLEKSKPFGEKGPYTIEKRRMKKVDTSDHSLKVGEVITVRNWGTFGCWDTKNRWVSLYESEHVETIKNWDRK